MGWHRRALILVASDDLEELDLTLAHEVTHYWYARLGLQGIWEVPAGTEKRIHTGCTSRHLEWFRANGESVTDYWRNQAYAEITELEMTRRVAMGTHR
jgi:hypothetical protein